LSSADYNETDAMDIIIARDGMASALRAATRAVHVRAERSGVIADMLHGRATKTAYALLLRNLLPAYQALETALEHHRTSPGLGPMARRELYRGPALEADLVGLCGADWRSFLPLTPAAERYALSVAAAAEGDGAGLAGHAYVRYLGDLSGGQILKRLLAQSLGLPETALSFYDFPHLTDIAAYKRSYIEALDRLEAMVDRGRVLAAAVWAFEINIEISESVKRLAAESALEPL
jgi:heme oxygenase